MWRLKLYLTVVLIAMTTVLETESFNFVPLWIAIGVVVDAGVSAILAQIAKDKRDYGY